MVPGKSEGQVYMTVLLERRRTSRMENVCTLLRCICAAGRIFSIRDADDDPSSVRML